MTGMPHGSPSGSPFAKMARTMALADARARLAPEPLRGPSAHEVAGACESSRTAGLALAGVLLLAAALRFWGLTHDLPFSYFGDELHLMKMSIAMGTGDLNPHWFHKPAFLNYLMLACYGAYFAVGYLTGRFPSTDAFGAHFLTDSAPFLWMGRLLVAAFGVLAVYLVYRIGREAFGSRAAGLSAAFLVAVLAPMVSSSQQIKQDIPCGALMALSVLVFLKTRDSDSLRPLVVASLVAGVAMGTHYYGVVLVPAYLLMEVLAAVTRRRPWRQALVRSALVPVVFLAGFFIASPYNFLDPTWPGHMARKVPAALGIGVEPHETHFEPDSKTVYKPGPSSWAGASADFFQVLASKRSMGLPLALLAGLGLGFTLARRETRWYGLLVLVPTAFFFFAAITMAAYHTQPRHLNAVYPLLATLAWPGAIALVRLVPGSRGSRRSPRQAVALALIAAAAIPTAAEAVRYNRRLTQPDSRLVAHRWIVANVPRHERLLLDDYGPPLNFDTRSAARQQALLRTLPRAPFTFNQGKRLALLRRFPAEDGFNLDELGHQWWRREEASDAELRSDPEDLDMGSPLVSRQPKTAREYAADGVRWVVTNSDARERYKDLRRGNFPSFRRFYASLEKARLVKTVDPAQWGGKGPIVWIYDLSPLAPAAGANSAVPTTPPTGGARPGPI